MYIYIYIHSYIYIYLHTVCILYAYMHIHGPVCGLLLSNHIDPKLLTGGRGTVVDLGRGSAAGKPWEKPWEITVFIWEKPWENGD